MCSRRTADRVSWHSFIIFQQRLGTRTENEMGHRRCRLCPFCPLSLFFGRCWKITGCAQLGVQHMHYCYTHEDDDKGCWPRTTSIFIQLSLVVSILLGSDSLFPAASRLQYYGHNVIVAPLTACYQTQRSHYHGHIRFTQQTFLHSLSSL